MPNMLPRLLYILAALAWFLLLRPNPVTIVMAGCFACLTLPVYRRMRCTIRHWRKRLRLRHPGRLGHIVSSCSHRLPLYVYIVMIFSAVVIPISTLVLLVSPQVAGGLARQRELQANNFQLPPEWVMRFQELRHSLADYPKVDKMISEFLSNLDAMLADTMGLLINRSVDVLGENNIYRYDAFLALTDRSESNILSCLIAKEFNVMRTVADVENLQFISQAEKLGIGTIINKKLLASSRIYKILLDADTDNAKCLSLSNAEGAEITVRKGAKITHGPVRKLHLPYGMTLGAYTRDGKCALVDGNTEIQAGDQVVVFCLTGSLTKIEKLFT